VVKELQRYDTLVASNFLEAELRSALLREGVEGDPEILRGIAWILPDRPLDGEIRQALRHGYLRGADLWHLASALYLAEDPTELTFLTLDQRQKEVAEGLGFRAPVL
jgi:hypothetical protein